jgi:hypothetical protein
MRSRHRAVTYDDVLAVAKLFEGFPGTWVITGGWALDLFAGRQTREHEDLDIVIDSALQHRVHEQLAGWRFRVNLGRRMMRWVPGMALGWPEYEIMAWLPGHRPSRFHILLNDCCDGQWRLPLYPAVVCSASRWCLTSEDGIPFNGPEIALLPKARNHRPKDDADLQAVLDLLDSGRRAWLRAALERYTPGHEWIALLAG